MTMEATPRRLSPWIEVSEHGVTLILHLGGELDRDGRSVVEPGVVAAIETARSVALDLAAVTACDEHGVAMIVDARERGRARDTAVAVRHAHPNVRVAFRTAGFEHVLDPHG